MQYGESNPQSNDRLVFDRIVAWSSLELYFLGLILWNTSLSGEIYIKRGIGTDASGRQTSVYDGVGYDRMDVVCRTGNGTGCLFIGTMFCVGGHGLADWTGFYYLKSTLILGIAALLCSTPLIYQRFEHAMCSRSKMRQMLCIVAYAVVFLICTAYLVNATYNPFLYFRF